MKTFDYETAWKELALPAYKQLPNAALCLVEETALVAADLHQDSQCCMIWPEDGGKLREQFDRLDSSTLARAAMVVYHYGHWRPGESIAGDAPTIKGGAHWKFSQYADQVLRARFNVGRDVKGGVGLLIHEGTVRVCYSSTDMWTWHEITPATEEGMTEAAKIADSLRRKIDISPRRDDRESAAYRAFEAIKTTVAWPGWDTSKYMIEESELELRQAERMPKADKEKLIAKVHQDFADNVAKLTTERDGELWLINHDLPTDNAIFYDHLGRWCFGWRKPIVEPARTELLAKLAKFPFSYDVK